MSGLAWCAWRCELPLREELEEERVLSRLPAELEEERVPWWLSAGLEEERVLLCLLDEPVAEPRGTLFALSLLEELGCELLALCELVDCE